MMSIFPWISCMQCYIAYCPIIKWQFLNSVVKWTRFIEYWQEKLPQHAYIPILIYWLPTNKDNLTFNYFALCDMMSTISFIHTKTLFYNWFYLLPWMLNGYKVVYEMQSYYFQSQHTIHYTNNTSKILWYM